MARGMRGDIWERSYGLKPGGGEARRARRWTQARFDAMGPRERRRAYLALTAAVFVLLVAVLAAGAALTSPPGPESPPAAGSGGRSPASESQGGQPASAQQPQGSPRARFSGLDSLSFMTDAQIDSLCGRARQHFTGAGFPADEVLRALAIPGEEDCFWVAASSQAFFAAVTPGQAGWDDAEISPCEKPERLSEYLDSRAGVEEAAPGGSEAAPSGLPEAAQSALPGQAAEFLADRGEPCRGAKTQALAPTLKETGAGCEVEVSAWLENGESRRLKASWDDASESWSFEVLH